MNLAIILTLGSVLFFGYIYFLSKTQKPRVGDKETDQDLDVINKMKEMQIIKDTKQVQNIAAKNKIFQRAYKNKYGSEIGTIIEEEHTSENNISYNENLIGAARTIIEEKKDIYNSNPITIEVSQEEDIVQEIDYPEFDTELMNELRNANAFEKKEKEILIEKQKEEYEEEKKIAKESKRIEDEYTEEELFVLNATYKTMQKFYQH